MDASTPGQATAKIMQTTVPKMLGGRGGRQPCHGPEQFQGWVGRKEIRAQEGEAETQEGTLSQHPAMKLKTELQGQPKKVLEQSEQGQKSPPASGSRLGSPAHPWPWEAEDFRSLQASESWACLIWSLCVCVLFYDRRDPKVL